MLQRAALASITAAFICAQTEGSHYAASERSSSQAAKTLRLLPARLISDVCVVQSSLNEIDGTGDPSAEQLLPLYLAFLSTWLTDLLGLETDSHPGEKDAKLKDKDQQKTARHAKQPRRDPDAQSILPEWKDCCYRWQWFLEHEHSSLRNATVEAQSQMFARCSEEHKLRVRYLSQLAQVNSFCDHL